MAGHDSPLLETIDRAYDLRSWHGPNLLGALRGVAPATAAWRPGPERHNIWEQVLHAAYWKYVARRGLTGEKRGAFPLKGSNWFERPEPGGATDETAWQADLNLLADMHAALRAAVAEARPADLRRVTGSDRLSNASVILGVAAHDVYHAGQIQLIRRLAESRGVSAPQGGTGQPAKKRSNSLSPSGKGRTTSSPAKVDARPKLNREWHLAHRMPPKATLDQRIAWHVEHRKHCGCREITGKLLEQMRARGLA